jgi:hypothetical protein
MSLHCQVAEKRSSASLSGQLTISLACQELLLTRRNGTLRRCSAPPSTPRGRLTDSPAWQEVAPYSSRRHSQDFESLASGHF